MPFPKRRDGAGTLHHVTGRGVAHRSLFETRRDVRAFLYPVACLVRRGWIRVLAFSVLTNHFHLLLRSVTGNLSEAIRLIEISYAMYFNRTRRRGDALFGRRFWSQRIDSDVYCDGVVRYIDLNAVKAGLADEPGDYPYCSAYYILRGLRLLWLDTTWIARRLAGASGHHLLPAEAYRRVFGPGTCPGSVRLVEQRVESRRSSNGPEPLEDLFGAGSPGVQAFLRRQTWLADQTEPGRAVVDIQTIQEEIGLAKAREPDWRCNPSGSRSRSAWPIVCVALLHELSGLTFTRIGRLVGCSRPSAHDRYQCHATCLESDADYRERHFELAEAALRRCHGYEA